MPGEKIGDAFVEIRAPLKAFASDLAKAKGNFVTFIAEITGLADVGLKAIANLGKAITLGLTVPLVGVSAISVATAADIEQSMLRVGVAFGDSLAKAEAWAAGVGAALRLNSQRILIAAADFQLMLIAIGLTSDEATGLSTGMTQLALDVAAFRGKKPEEIFKKFRSAITGNTAVIHQLGADISDVTIAQLALAKGITKSVGAMTFEEKAVLRIDALFLGFADAAGAAGAQINNLSSLFGQLTDQTNAFSAAWGRVMLPVTRIGTLLLTKLAQVATWFAQVIAGWPQSIRFAIGTVVALFAALGPMIIATAIAVGWFLKMELAVSLLAVANRVLGRTSLFVAGAQKVLALATKFAATAFGWLAKAVLWARVSLIRFLVMIPVVGLALVALGEILGRVFGQDDDIKEMKDELAEITAGLEEAGNAAKGLLGNFRELGSIGIAQFKRMADAAKDLFANSPLNLKATLGGVSALTPALAPAAGGINSPDALKASQPGSSGGMGPVVDAIERQTGEIVDGIAAAGSMGA